MSSTSSATSFDSRSFLATLTDAPGVYRMLDAAGGVLYVGKAKNLKRRVSSYFQKTGHSPRIALMLQQVAHMEVTATRSEAEALILENTLIKKLVPKYNILFRDDKSYPYIGLSGGTFPRLFYHRGGFDKKSRYFGPFPNALAVRESIQLVQKAFLLRTCENAVFAHRSRPCLLHQIHRCTAPCVGLISADDYATDVRLAELFLRGKHSEVIDNLSARMSEAADQLKFEDAAMLRDQIKSLQAVLHRQYVSSTREADVDIIAAVVEHGEPCVNLAMVRGGLHLGDRAYFPQAVGGAEAGEVLAAFVAQHYADKPIPARIILSPWPLDDALEGVQAGRHAGPAKNEMERAWLAMAENNARLAMTSRKQANTRSGSRLAALQEALDLSDPPHRIECFDISHTMGEGTVASCVVCVDGAMKKSDYRRFNISGITGGDDYAAMRQALTRRYAKVGAGETANTPDLVLIDGGKGQHSIARDVFAELGLDHLQSIGVAKGEGRKPGLETLFVHGRSEPLQLAMDNAGFHLLQEIRDEAHRFAIVGHRARRAKARGHSKLEDIAGIGPARRRNLLAQFGGLDGVRAATIEDLCRVTGISRHLAEAIYTQLRS
ncbi:MAG: excinuclease ABC subunit UvrC [Rugosibacter sp.]|nr:MAG: excinuclease ABC subunit UvrC [Rugosibacter sp.]